MTTTSLLYRCAAVLFALMIAQTALAQRTENRQAAEVAAALIEDAFVDEGRAKEIARELRARTAAGAFDAIGSRSALATSLTAAIQAIEDDKHMSVSYNSSKAAEPLLTVAQARERLAALRAGGPGGTAAQNDFESARRANFEIRRAEHLPGNVGYVRIDAFHDLAVARETITAAMKFLEHVDAMIVDLRENRGGANSSVVYLASYFLPADNRTLVASRWRNMPPREAKPVETPTRRFEDVPLYILISNETFSAGEGFSFMLQQFGRATVVGETTKGGGRPNAFLPMGGGLTLSVSIGAVTHPATGKSWQGVGVVPDVKTAPADALETARRLAVERRGAKAPGSDVFASRVAEIIEAINSGPEALERFAQNHFVASYLAQRTPEQRRSFVERARGDFGKLKPGAIQRPSPGQVRVELEGETGTRGALVIDYETEAPHKITALRMLIGEE